MTTDAAGGATARRWSDDDSMWPKRAATLTIKDVADACGLPQPLIAQLIPRTWVDNLGWMYIRENLDYAVDLANRLRAERRQVR